MYIFFYRQYCLVPLNQAKLSAGGAASLLQVRVTEPPSVTSPPGKTDMEVEWGASAVRGEKKEVWSLCREKLKETGSRTFDRSHSRPRVRVREGDCTFWGGIGRQVYAPDCCWSKRVMIIHFSKEPRLSPFLWHVETSHFIIVWKKKSRNSEKAIVNHQRETSLVVRKITLTKILLESTNILTSLLSSSHLLPLPSPFLSSFFLNLRLSPLFPF